MNGRRLDGNGQLHVDPLLKHKNEEFGERTSSDHRHGMTKVDRHELLSIVSMAVGTLFLMTGYDTQSFIVESVLHSVNRREPNRIDGHAGYYGQSALYAAYTLATLFSPWLCCILGSKWALCLGSLLFSLYLSGFFFLHSWFYYGTQIAMGLGFALYYSGQGMFMAEHSRRHTISRNSALISSIGNAGMCVGGVALFIISYYTPSLPSSISSDISSNSTLSSVESNYRSFSDKDIYILFGTFLSLTLLANIIFALLPTKQYDSIALLEVVQKPTIKTQIGLISGAIREPRILLLSFFFIQYGLQVSFMLSAFPTTFAFTHSLSEYTQLPAYYSITIGLGNIIVGIYINAFSRRWPLFGLIPTMITQLVLAALTYSMVLLCIPNWSSIHPNNHSSLFFKPTPTLCIITGLLLGMADGCLCPMRVIICTLVIPEKKLQTYSVAKLYQSLASCLAFFLSPYLSIYSWITLLTVSQILSAAAFIWVSRKIAKDTIKCDDLTKNCDTISEDKPQLI